MRLVLLPGMDGSGELFAGFIAALPSWLSTQVLRYPGDAQLSYDQLREIVQPQLPDSPFLLLAESFSSPLAIRIAATALPSLRGVIICAGFVESPVRGLRGKLLYWVAPALFRLPLMNFPIRRWLLGEEASPELVRSVRAAIGSSRPNVLAGRLRAVVTCRGAKELRTVRVPILYVAATEDRLIGERGLEQFQRVKPNTTVARIRGPHLILQSNPGDSVSAITSFIRHIL